MVDNLERKSLKMLKTFHILCGIPKFLSLGIVLKLFLMPMPPTALFKCVCVCVGGGGGVTNLTKICMIF